MPQDNQQQQQTPYIAQLAQQAGTTATQGLLGGIFGQIFAKSNDKRQLRQQEKLQNLQIKGQQQLTDYNYQKQLQMWKDTSYGAQMEQLQKAGLNPGLIYGMGGAGGQSNNIQQGQVTGGHAEQNPGEVQQFAGMALQSGLMAAQMRLIDAQTKNIQADTANKPIVGENIKTDTAMKLANTGNIEQDTQLKKIATQIDQVQLDIQKSTIEEQIHTITQTAAKLDEEVMQMAVKTNMDRATQNDKISTIHQELFKVMLENALIKSQTAKTGQETKLLSQENKYYVERFTAELSRIAHQNYADIHTTGALEQNAATQSWHEAWQQFLHDVPDTDKIPLEMLEKAGQVLFLRELVKPTTTRSEIGGFHKR